MQIDWNGLDWRASDVVCPSDQSCRWNWHLKTSSFFRGSSKIVQDRPKYDVSASAGRCTASHTKISMKVDWNMSDQGTCVRVFASDQKSGRESRLKFRIWATRSWYSGDLANVTCIYDMCYCLAGVIVRCSRQSDLFRAAASYVMW